MNNPVIVTVKRGGAIESQHRGSAIVSDANGKVAISLGNITSPIFPRSAIKAFQCIPLLASGAAEAIGLNDEEIALCCASHDGESHHVRVARSILAKTGIPEAAYECGAHWPSSSEAARQLARERHEPLAVHNNCSGKHAGMLALAKHIGANTAGYTNLNHPVQDLVAATLQSHCNFDLTTTAVGIDGCSVPTWAIPLHNLALGFARLAAPAHPEGNRIITAVRSNPMMIGGTKSFDTRIMQHIPRLFIKVGAEGVYCGCIQHAGLGFALKCDDGGTRAAQVGIAGLLLRLDCWTKKEKEALTQYATHELRNWRGMHVGEVSSVV